MLVGPPIPKQWTWVIPSSSDACARHFSEACTEYVYARLRPEVVLSRACGIFSDGEYLQSFTLRSNRRSPGFVDFTLKGPCSVNDWHFTLFLEVSSNDSFYTVDKIKELFE